MSLIYGEVKRKLKNVVTHLKSIRDKIYNVIYIMFNKYLKYRDIKHMLFNIQYWFKPIIRTKYWDWEYMIDLEYFQLKQMLKYFIKSDLTTNNEFIVRDIRICITLIEIIKNEAEDVTYINIKNYKRFTPEITEEQINGYLKDRLAKEVAIEKAFSLYNKIRSYKMQTWWD